MLKQATAMYYSDIFIDLPYTVSGFSFYIFSYYMRLALCCEDAVIWRLGSQWAIPRMARAEYGVVLLLRTIGSVVCDGEYGLEL